MRYRAIAAKGGWPSLPPNTRLKPHQQSAVVPTLRQRLAIEGDLDPAHEKDPSPIFDDDRRRGGEAVRRAPSHRARRHRRCRDRERAERAGRTSAFARSSSTSSAGAGCPIAMPDRYFVVNVPDFRLEAIENGKAVMDMRVVVGAPDNKTPIFADEMTHVVFSPYWNVPPGIAEDETIPQAVNDPGFLARNNMEVVSAVGRGRRSELRRLVEREGPAHPAAAGQRQRARRREVHFPEQLRRLSARYECDQAVRPHRARSEPRLRARRRAAQARAVRASRPAGVDGRRPSTQR